MMRCLCADTHRVALPHSCDARAHATARRRPPPCRRLYNGALSRKAAQSLASRLANLPALQDVALVACGTAPHPDAWKALAPALGALPTLLSLRLSQCKLGSLQSPPVGRAAAALRHLSHLDLSQNALSGYQLVSTGALAELRQLRDLDLGCNPLACSLLSAVEPGPAVPRGLRRLGLRSCELCSVPRWGEIAWSHRLVRGDEARGLLRKAAAVAANIVYRRVGNILYLHESETAVNDDNGCAMSFEKCDRSSCDEAAEFAARFAVDIHLPTFSGTDILFDSPLTTGVEVIARKKANSPAGVELIPTYGAGRAGDDGWCFAFETTRVKLPENMRDRVAPVVYADEKCSDNRLQIALHDRAKQFGFDHFYRAVIVVQTDGTRKLTFHRLVVEPYPWRSCVIYG